MLELNIAIDGSIKIAEYVAVIIETPLFLRLKRISQLGLLPFVHQSVRSSRWEHCIGTYFRARRFLDSLEKNSPSSVNTPELYRKAVEIAALLHDIGHGPFSHVWELICDHKYDHEENSIACIDTIFSQIRHEPSLADLFENKDNGLELIKALVVGDINRLSTPLPDSFKFIFEIVNNKRCGIDVDKWDYLKRDNYYLQELSESSLNFEDVFREARIAADGSHIEYRYEDYDKIYKLFEARWLLHMRCYRTPKVLACEELLYRMVKRSTAAFHGRPLREISVTDDLRSFLELDDDTLLKLFANDEELEYLKNTDRLVELNIDDIAKLKFKNDKLISVKSTLPGPGVAMRPDEFFQFYGYICDKKPITRNNTSYEKFVYFGLQ